MLLDFIQKLALIFVASSVVLGILFVWVGGLAVLGKMMNLRDQQIPRDWRDTDERYRNGSE